MSRLRTELSWLRRRSALKVGSQENKEATLNATSTRACTRCQAQLGLILNRGALCPSCKQRVCKECRKYGGPLGTNSNEWVCVICSKQIEIEVAAGDWMNAFAARRPSRKREKACPPSSPSEGIRNALLRRSWSISSPTTTSDTSSELPKPTKPPRKIITTDDESVSPVTPSSSPKKPPRRYSMSSFDSISSRNEHRGGDTTKCYPQSPAYYTPRPAQNPPKYLFGAEPAEPDVSRPSTLPRRLIRTPRPLSYGDFEDDPGRFHSMPRKRDPHRRLDVGHFEKGTASKNTSYLSSGPITSTPINSSVPTEASVPAVRREPVAEKMSARIKERHRRSLGEFWEFPDKRAFSEINSRLDHKENFPQFKKLPKTCHSEKPFHFDGSNKGSGNFLAEEDARRPWRSQPVQSVSHPREEISSPPRWGLKAPLGPNDSKSSCHFGKGFIQSHIDPFEQQNYNQHRKLNRELGTCAQIKPFNYNNQAKTVGEEASTDRHNENKKYSSDFKARNVEERFEWSLDNRRLQESTFADKSPEFQRPFLQMAAPKARLNESERSRSSDTSEGSGFSIGPSELKPRLPRSNTSISSGFSSMGRMKRVSSAPVRRSKSFQAGWTRRNAPEVDPYPRRLPPGSHVAKFVLEFEKGIRDTVSNMTSSKGSALTPSTSLKDPHSVYPLVSSRPSRSEPEGHAAPPDDMQDNSRYKIVFISSGSSSKDSDLSSSGESESPRLIKESLPNKKNKSAPQLVNAQQLTKELLNSHDEHFPRSQVTPPPPPPLPPPPPSEGGGPMFESTNFPELKRNLNSKLFPQEPDNSKKRDDQHSNFTPKMTSLDQGKLEAMLQQTEDVQAEAKALQSALMGAFDKNPATNLFLVKGEVEESPTPKHPSSSSEYENVKVVGKRKEDSRLYENLDFGSNGIIRRVEGGRDASTQTDIVYEEDEDEEDSSDFLSLESSYYEGRSVASSDSCIPDSSPSDRIDKSVETVPFSANRIKYFNYNNNNNNHNNNNNNSNNKNNNNNNSKMNNNINSHYNNNTETSRLISNEDNDNNNNDDKEYRIKMGMGFRGEESSSSRPYLADSSPASHTPSSPTVHLRLASDGEQRSVSVSSRCEQVRARELPSSGRFRSSYESAVSRRSANQFGVVNNSSVLNESALVTSADGELLSSSIAAAAAAAAARPGLLRSVNNPVSRPEPPPPPPPPLHPSTAHDNSSSTGGGVKLPWRNMNTPENKEEGDDSTNSVGDVNAFQEVIFSSLECKSGDEAPAAAAAAAAIDGAAEIQSSDTSAGEDTDEDVHVSRSYDVSRLNDEVESDTGASNVDEESATDESGSETDEGRNVTKRYEVTKVSSESESDVESRDGDAIMSEVDIQRDSNEIKNLSDMCSGALLGGRMEEEDIPKGEGPLKCEGEVIEEEVSISDTEEELPECDQVLEEEEGAGIVRDSGDEVGPPPEEGREEEGVDAQSVCHEDEEEEKEEEDDDDLTVENKSETESIIGLEVDSLEDGNKGELLEDGGPLNSEEVKEGNENHQVQESDPGEKRSEEDEGKTKSDGESPRGDDEVLGAQDCHEHESLTRDESGSSCHANLETKTCHPESSLEATNESTTAPSGALTNDAFDIIKPSNCSECQSPEISGSQELEQENGSRFQEESEAVLNRSLVGSHESSGVGDVSVPIISDNISNISANDVNSYISNRSDALISQSDKTVLNSSSSSESGHSSGGESDDVDDDKKEPDNVLKINVAEKRSSEVSEKRGSRKDVRLTHTEGKVGKRGSSIQCLNSSKFSSKGSTPPVPLRKARLSSSSDGLSSSSDVDRSDADASDSADTVIEGTKLHSKRVNSSARSDANRDSDGPSSADSVLQGVDSESQCSDGSEEGNLITIVAVGEETILKPSSSQGKIYIRSDSTDSDVQIKPTCIVVTGSSGDDSSEDSENDDQNKTNSNTENEVTILEVTSDHRKDHVMSVRVTSPESSRSASPSRKSTVSELQSMILTTREKQQQFRRPTVEVKESSGLTNYFTVTLGTDSPATPRRLNKTPEVRRRKVPEKDEKDSTGTNLAVRSPTLTPSPSHTPSPTLTPTPDHSEGDLLALEEHHEDSQTDPENSRDNLTEEGNEIFEYEGNFDQYDYHDLHQEEEMEGPFDSIEDTDSLCDSNNSETSSEEGFEREEELRGYCKRGYDFTLHTIIEESCEESDYDKKVHEEENVKRDTSELEQYFYFGLGNGPAEPKKFANEESEYSDTFSETSSSIYSEGMESLDCEEEVDPAELASSRLEKYFSGFSGFERQPSIRSVGEESEMHTDESGSVGSDSEGSPSPEQPRKRLFRSRGVRSVSSNRSSHGYSSDKGDGVISDGSHHSGEGEEDKTLVSGEDEGSTESEETAFDKGDGQFDTIKRRKKKKLVSESSDKKLEDRLDPKTFLIESRDDNFNSSGKADFGHTIFNEIETSSKNIDNDDPKALKNQSKEIVGTDLVGRKYQSRDSGFIGSSDDLLKDKPDDMIIKGAENDEIIPLMANLKEYSSKKLNEKNSKVQGDKENGFKDIPLENEPGNSKSENEERSSNEGKVSRSSTGSSVDLPPYSQSKGCPNLNRKDSFNNWSSDEETNIMMNKMRIFFKNMFSNVGKEAPKGQRIKSPQLVMFEAKLTNLMRSVPGINDEQVKEIMEYLSSEETWSDSYDSSDYTSSDLEGTYPRLDQADPELKSELQEQISASCQQIIKNFDQSREPSDTDSSQSLFGGRANSESSEASSKDTAFVYQKLMSSISHMKPESERGSIGSGSQSTSPSLLMKVMPYIRDRLVALMHEVSAGSENGDDVDSFNGGNPVTSSPRQKLFLPKKHSISDNLSLDSSVDKSSLTSTSFESEDSPTDTEQSPESDTGTPKIFRRQKLSIISEKSSAEDFTSLESQRTVFSSHDSPRYYFRHDMGKTTPAAAPSQRSLEERSGPLSSPFARNKEEEKFFSKEYGGLLKGSRNGRRAEARKAKSHMSLEKIHQEEVKTTGERSESLGDLLDRVRSSSEFSSSYEQLDSDSTLKASDSLDRHIGSSNVRLNASSRGSLTTSSRGSLATSSRGSLNASSRGSLQGSSGPEEEEDRKGKKLPFFRYARRSSVPDASKDAAPSPEVRSTTLPRSTPAQILTTGTLPRSQSSHPSRSSSGALTLPSSSLTTNERPSLYHSSGGPRSARYHPPGYRPPPAGLPPKRTYSTPTLRKDKRFPSSEESGAACGGGGGVSAEESAGGGAAGMTITAPVPPPPSRFSVLGGGGSLGRGSLASFERSAADDDDDDDEDDDEEESFKRRGSDGGGGGTRSPLISLGLARHHSECSKVPQTPSIY